MALLNISTNASNQSNGLSEGCFAVKCHFTATERIAIIVTFSVTFLASFAGNFVVFFMITRTRRLRNCTNFSILNLCIADLLITMFCIPILTIDFYIADEWLLGSFMCKMVTFLQYTSLYASVLILFTISIEKFTAVCFPIRVRIYRKWFCYTVLMGWLIAIAGASHTTMFKKIIVFKGHQKCVMEYPQNTRDRQLFLMGHDIGFFFLPLLIMTILHCITIYSIQKKISGILGKEFRHHAPIMKSNPDRLQKNRKAVAILVSIVVLFIISWGPYLCIGIWDTFYTPSPQKRESYHLALNKIVVVCVWMMFFNTVFHPIIYCFLGRKYRDELRVLFQRRKRQEETQKRTSRSSDTILESLKTSGKGTTSQRNSQKDSNSGGIKCTI